MSSSPSTTKVFHVGDRVLLWKTFRGTVVRASRKGYIKATRDDKPWLSEPETFHVNEAEKLNDLDRLCEEI